MNFDNIQKVKRSKPLTVLDAALAVIIAATIGVSFWLIYRKPAQTVVITAPGVSMELPLGKDGDVQLEHLTVHIRGGKVWVSDADCPDKVCERTGEIGRSGQSIVCLPNGVAVRITGDGDLQWEIGT